MTGKENVIAAMELGARFKSGGYAKNGICPEVIR